MAATRMWLGKEVLAMVGISEENLCRKRRDEQFTVALEPMLMVGVKFLKVSIIYQASTRRRMKRMEIFW